MKKIIINFLVLAIVKTKIILLLEKKIFHYRSLKYQGKSFLPYLKYNRFDYLISTVLYFRFYYRNLNDPNKQRRISLNTLGDGEGKYWAKHYYYTEVGHKNSPQQVVKARKNIYEETIKLINNYGLDKEDSLFINLGSSSGKDIEFFYNHFKKFKYISIDVNQEIISFQKEVLNIPNIKYHVGTSEKAADIIKKYQNNNSKILIFTNGTLQYEIPYFLNEMFKSLKTINNKIYFCLAEHYEKIFKENINIKSYHRKNILWVHNYEQYLKENNFNILFQRVNGEGIRNLNLCLIFSNKTSI